MVPPIQGCIYPDTFITGFGTLLVGVWVAVKDVVLVGVGVVGVPQGPSGVYEL